MFGPGCRKKICARMLKKRFFDFFLKFYTSLLKSVYNLSTLRFDVIVVGDGPSVPLTSDHVIPVLIELQIQVAAKRVR